LHCPSPLVFPACLATRRLHDSKGQIPAMLHRALAPARRSPFLRAAELAQRRFTPRASAALHASPPPSRGCALRTLH